MQRHMTVSDQVLDLRSSFETDLSMSNDTSFDAQKHKKYDSTTINLVSFNYLVYAVFRTLLALLFPELWPHLSKDVEI